ncbi:hypothetical protein OEV98_04060 [Caldibacillus lycopersici]|uniref:Uncharacterized protein n=1 Tax=Perspicuibacillus lycopersici TaxID=1325689 RepID=A0AAE3ISQ1_9BACI|nr:hypothetical protein [Perspicuibacillus lycopersici]MCU9612739.1 hypothetical protein [Perspicuibacillus lycopersici]
MLRRKDLLTTTELLEVRKLQNLILGSNSIFKTKRLERRIYEICENAEKRYHEFKGVKNERMDEISRIQDARREGKKEGVKEVVMALRNSGMQLKEISSYTHIDVQELELLLKE